MSKYERFTGSAALLHTAPLPSHLARSEQPSERARVLAAHASAHHPAACLLALLDQGRDWFKESEIADWAIPGMDVVLRGLQEHGVLVRKVNQSGTGSYFKPTPSTRPWCLIARAIHATNQ